MQEVPAKPWRKLIGYVGQEPVLFATSAMKNLKAGNDFCGMPELTNLMLFLLSPEPAFWEVLFLGLHRRISNTSREKEGFETC